MCCLCEFEGTCCHIPVSGFVETHKAGTVCLLQLKPETQKGNQVKVKVGAAADLPLDF